VETEGSLAETWARADGLATALLHAAAEVRPRATLELEQVLGCLGQGPSRGPRGLDPLRLALEIGGRDVAMERLAALLEPSTAAPWYRAARPEEGPPGPEVHAGPLALWSLARGRVDEDFLLAAAASLARLTHPTADAIGNTCVLVLALQEAAVGPRASGPLQSRLEEWRKKAAGWAGGAFPDRISPVLQAAAEHPEDVEQARAACERLGGDQALAGAVVALRANRRVDGWPAPVVAAASRLWAADPPLPD
jgi:hypothetical protein